MFGKKKNKKLDDKETEKIIAEDKEMGFLDHLGELRTRIIWAVVGFIIGSIIAAVFIQNIVDIVLLKPAVIHGLKLQNLKPFGQPMLYFKLIFIIGFILSFPFMLYQLWKFIAPGLYINERGWARIITFYTSLCFLSGVAFSYFVMIPSMLNFAAQFGSSSITNNIDVNEYLGFIGMMILASGIVFEMPMIVFVLARFGLVTTKFLRKYRRHSIIIILIIAAVITPTPDPISQLIFAAPLFILYEISILVAKFSQKKFEESKTEKEK